MELMHIIVMGYDKDMYAIKNWFIRLMLFCNFYFHDQNMLSFSGSLKVYIDLQRLILYVGFLLFGLYWLQSSKQKDEVSVVLAE